jgi:hypothetical protein
MAMPHCGVAVEDVCIGFPGTGTAGEPWSRAACAVVQRTGFVKQVARPVVTNTPKHLFSLKFTIEQRQYVAESPSTGYNENDSYSS